MMSTKLEDIQKNASRMGSCRLAHGGDWGLLTARDG